MIHYLYVVSTPIGNPRDITLRAIDVLKSVDFIICEELKPAGRLLASYQIKKELIRLNEHNEKESAIEIIEKIKSGESAALISDCGTPVFSDPGKYLLDLAINEKIKIVTVPGASSLMAALSGAGVNPDRFYFYGWLSRKKDIRKNELYKLKKIKELIVLMETPYRLISLLRDVKAVFGPNRRIVLCYELTTEREEFFRGTVADIYEFAREKNLKGEFVLLIQNDY